jgi:hypothetical protein
MAPGGLFRDARGWLDESLGQPPSLAAEREILVGRRWVPDRAEDVEELRKAMKAAALLVSC